MAENGYVFDSLEADVPVVRTIANLNRLHRFDLSGIMVELGDIVRVRYEIGQRNWLLAR